MASTETAQQETADATSDPVAESRASQHYDPSKIQNWTTFRGGSPCIASIGNRIPAIIFHDGSGFELVPDWLTPLELYREKIVLEPPDLKQTEEPLTDLINIYGRNVRLIPSSVK